MEDQAIEPNIRTYEIAFLLSRPEGESIVGDVFTRARGEITHRSQLNEIKLAYPIRKQSSAHFGFFRVKASPEAITAISGALRREETVLRFLVVTHAPKERGGGFDRARRREEGRVAPRTEVLTNKALEEKLEEIMK